LLILCKSALFETHVRIAGDAAGYCRRDRRGCCGASGCGIALIDRG
jgi:hypothetical protein